MASVDPPKFVSSVCTEAALHSLSLKEMSVITTVGKSVCSDNASCSCPGVEAATELEAMDETTSCAICVENGVRTSELATDGDTSLLSLSSSP